MEKNEKYRHIFLASHALFLSQGYEAATIRRISDQAGVSLGLTNHFFHSKQELAGLVLDMLFAYGEYQCRIHYSGSDPLLSAALSVRVNTLYLTRGMYHRFYVDCLKHDIFFHRLEKTSDTCLYQLAETCHFPVDHDLFLLYGRYVPYNCEKTLILNKEKGMFSTISYDEIPDYIMISKFEHFLDGQVLNQALQKARQEAEGILNRMPDVVPETFLLDFLDELPD